MQVLAENRWEDYEWESEGERYAYWGQGISWVESPELDPLGVEEQDAWRTTTTIPRKDSDLSFYLWKGPPLPRSCIPSFQKSRPWLQNGTDKGVTITGKPASDPEQAVKPNGAVNGASKVQNGVVNGAFVAPNGVVNGDSDDAEETQRVGMAFPV